MTDEEMVDKFKRQHLSTYKEAVKEIIRNNTNALIEEDIFSLIKTPPLDSMDLIKGKLLSLAKKEKIVLNTTMLNQLIDHFRDTLKNNLIDLKQIREDVLIQKVEMFEPKRETEIINITTKDLSETNKNIKKQVKKQSKDIVMKLEKNLNRIYVDETNAQTVDKINEQFIKYMNGSYQKQLLENIAMKTMIKDRTLTNGVNEQGERYLFTKNNSHLFDSEKKGARK